jgi:hypothetical protein
MRPPKITVNVKPEQPMLSFNRLCFGVMNNDWILVASSGVKLILSALLLLQVYNKSM